MASSKCTTNLCENCEDADLEAVFRIFAPPKVRRLRRDNDPGPTFDTVRRKSTPQVEWQWSTLLKDCALCSMLQELELPSQPDPSEYRAWAEIFDLDLLKYRQPNEKILIQVRPGVPLVTLGSRKQPWDNTRNVSGDWAFTNEKGSGVYTIILNGTGIALGRQISSLVELDITGQTEVDLSDMDTLATIDTHSMLIVDKPPHERYLTLSYVWGSGSDNEAFGVRIPKTIQDAITATKRLGYRYLWVDRFCIDQKSEKRKQAQIRQMDRIYSNASLCLVAAAGDSPKHGLPGVSEPRPVFGKKPFYVIGDTTLYLAHNTLDIWSLVEKSKWASRGWTFQELLFSKRLVFFTEMGLILKTSKNWYLEWDFTEEGFSRNPIGRVCWPPSSGDIHSFSELLSEYTVRNMTFPSDILNGFAGVLNRYASLDKQMGHFCGIFYHEARPWVFLWGILWTMEISDEGSYVRIRGREDPRIERRIGFPSWSWCGWYGQTWTYILDLENRYELNQTDINLRQPEVLVELEDGSRISVPEAGGQSFNNPHMTETAYLILSSRFVELVPSEEHDSCSEIRRKDSPSSIDSEGRYHLSSSQPGILPYVWEQAEQGNPVECVGLVLNLGSWDVVPLMRKGDHWERCGVENIRILRREQDWSTILRERATELERQEQETFRHLSGLKLEWGQFKVG